MKSNFMESDMKLPKYSIGQRVYYWRAFKDEGSSSFGQLQGLELGDITITSVAVDPSYCPSATYLYKDHSSCLYSDCDFQEAQLFLTVREAKKWLIKKMRECIEKFINHEKRN
jgi:hypothetical protein